MNQTASKSIDTMKKTTDEIVEVNDDLNQRFSKFTISLLLTFLTIMHAIYPAQRISRR
jgi:hypothetical protein